MRFYILNGGNIVLPEGLNVQVSFQNEPKSVYDVECSEEFKVLIDAVMYKAFWIGLKLLRVI